MRAYGIDHLVIAVGDLERGRETFTRLGFQVAPTATHPFGTANAVIQLGNAYLELLGIADPERITDTTETMFSFAAFNRDFLADREGVSMLVRKSDDADADRRQFADRGLQVFEPFEFERMARGPDGLERKVGFSLAFTADTRLKRAGFATCHHHHPENFWREAYQSHPNGAEAIATAIMVAPNPADFHEFMTLFTGQHAIESTSLGIKLDLGDGSLDILSPIAFSAFFDEDPQDKLYRFAAVRISVSDLAATARFLAGNAVPVCEIAGAFVVPAKYAHGAAIAFVQSTPPKVG